ncbi:Uncharacterised protein [Sphingobacterium spiritivorum]|uniref:Sulfotransferase family n=1 Tax=Sphingobacterium spiritivorum TaxID=258 RepID=A0A380BHB4_SPHSI|nr:hypothetical protein [Sphingobacterium spiritivorum]SUJ01371.1 Uncharacterised protein [Sphingobacterium spiritivorum]
MLYNWIPYSLKWEENEWKVLWLDLADHIIQESFFDETILDQRIYMRNRSKYQPQSSVEYILKLADQLESMAPTAFIFHVSRCGSTLLSQCLATDTSNIMIPEAPVLDEILRIEESDETLLPLREQLFKTTVKLMGQKRLAFQTKYFIKLDSWHIHFYDVLRSWYPNVPFYFLTREPEAIIASQKKRRGIHCIPGYINEKLLKVPVRPGHFENFDSFTADVLQQFYDGIREIKSKKHHLNFYYDYSWGVSEMITDFNKAIGNTLGDLEGMRTRLTHHSKYPDQIFQAEAPLPDSVTFEHTHTAYQQVLKQIIRQ